VSPLGEKYTIHEYTTFEKAIYLSGEESLTPVSKSLKTSSGHSVNRIRKGEYEILDAYGASGSHENTRVTSTDLNAA
jgi:hypothetical protein